MDFLLGRWLGALRRVCAMDLGIGKFGVRGARGGFVGASSGLGFIAIVGLVVLSAASGLISWRYGSLLDFRDGSDLRVTSCTVDGVAGGCFLGEFKRKQLQAILNRRFLRLVSIDVAIASLIRCGDPRNPFEPAGGLYRMCCLPLRSQIFTAPTPIGRARTTPPNVADFSRIIPLLARRTRGSWSGFFHLATPIEWPDARAAAKLLGIATRLLVSLGVACFSRSVLLLLARKTRGFWSRRIFRPGILGRGLDPRAAAKPLEISACFLAGALRTIRGGVRRSADWQCSAVSSRHRTPRLLLGAALILCDEIR
mmetsp:Transcript_2627/g.6987  ORF Transcript_2627/g.6987 Transcript_2627/m.6987 type:complete len:311 (-) Transcript_2627:165-1097(-)